MNIHEIYYQLTAVVLMAIAMSISITYRLRAKRSGDKIDTLKE
jgi:hypothetical protein